MKMELGRLSLGTHWFPGDSGTFGLNLEEFVFDRDFTLISTLAKTSDLAVMLFGGPRDEPSIANTWSISREIVR